MADTIKIGSLDISAFKVGSDDCKVYLGDILLYPTTPTGSTCYEIISTPITSYTSTTYDSVYSFADSKWYMLNNLTQYEEYGVYDIVEDIASATTYEGKLGVVGETEYQYSGGSWSVVGSYIVSSVTYTIDRTSPSPYVGQELSTTFKIPYADVQAVRYVDLTIEDNNINSLEISINLRYSEYEYRYRGSDSYNGTVTYDREYFYLSLPSEAPQSIVINSVRYRSSTPIHIIASSKQPTVEYAEKDIPLGNVYDTVAEMETVGCPNVGVGQYGVVSNDAYQFDGEDWNSVSNYKLMEKNADGKAYVLVCNSSTDLVNEEAQPSYFGNITAAVIGDYCVTTIGNGAFNGCSGLTNIVIPDSVTSIGNNAFYNCRGLTSCTIGSGVTSIGNYAFMYCSGLTSVNIPSGVTTIGEEAFGACKSLMSVVIPDSVTSISILVFSNCTSLTSVTIPDSVTTIGNNAFYYCTGLTSIVIPDSVTTIGVGAISFCYSLTSIVIPDSVTTIGNGGFQNCSGLTSITVNAVTPPTLGNANVFTNTNEAPILVPSASVNAYKSATNWSTYASRIQAIPNS